MHPISYLKRFFFSSAYNYMRYARAMHPAQQVLEQFVFVHAHIAHDIKLNASVGGNYTLF